MLFGSRTNVGRVTLVKSMPGRSCEIKCKRMFYTDERLRERKRNLVLVFELLHILIILLLAAT
jgi:hypothetical protein